jgi:hypothetical protein
LMARYHPKIHFYINRADIQYLYYIIYTIRRVPLLLSSLLWLGRGLGCRAEIRTRASRRAIREVNNALFLLANTCQWLLCNLL